MARGTATNKLVDVMQVLQMARKTGTLLVNRDGINNTVEQGAMILQNGQIIDAVVGPYRGTEALQQLQGWGRCYFVLQTPSQTGASPQPFTQMSPANKNQAPKHQSGPIPSIGAKHVPQRIRELNDILPHFNRLGLTRMHRQLFLLIDGQRSVPEIIRLMGHRTDEVDTLLNDLERAGLIRW
ncbi:MAG TPA: DUF4388 domain-containing protein [Ktedonobacteraceae bacterium]|jgi:hypothetical protein|nr:DUF4388 domain-containing protein [Ktedonobacteraceae bacterium]